MFFDILHLKAFSLLLIRAPEINMSELENLFSAAVPNSDPGGKSGKRGAIAPKTEKVQLVI